MTDRSRVDPPRWVLVVGPLAVLGAVFGLLYVTSPFAALVTVEDASTLEILGTVTAIGAIAGVVPVAVGMLWFPVIRDLDPRYLHSFMALAAGVLVFIATQMIGDILGYSVEADSTLLAATLAVVGVGGTFLAAYAVSEWRRRTVATSRKSGLEVAYLVALALGLHSIGEGLGIGVAYVRGDATLVTLLVLAFVLHNVMEGPTVVAAVARETKTPPLRHFAAMGVIAGGPVILGGWLGSFANSPLLAILFYAIAVGAIGQVLLEVADLIRFDAEAVFTRINAATFSFGFVLMFLLEDVLVDLLVSGSLVSV